MFSTTLKISGSRRALHSCHPLPVGQRKAQQAYWVELKIKQKSLNKAESLKRIHEPQIPPLERRFYRNETDRHAHIIIKQAHSKDRAFLLGGGAGRALAKQPPGIGSRKAVPLSGLRWAQGCGSQCGTPGPHHKSTGNPFSHHVLLKPTKATSAHRPPAARLGCGQDRTSWRRLLPAHARVLCGRCREVAGKSLPVRAAPLREPQLSQAALGGD